MISNMKKLLALLLAFVMCVGVFAGCGKTQAPAQQGTESPYTGADTIVFANDYMSEKFSPFFADTSYDQDAAGMTQISLLSSDREGNVVARYEPTVDMEIVREAVKAAL